MIPRAFVLALLSVTFGVAACSSDNNTVEAGGAGGSGAGTGNAGGNHASGSDAGEGGSDAGEGGSDAGEGGSDPGEVGEGDSGAGGAGPTVTGDVPAELVGIWQETRASAGDYTNSWGDNFSITSGLSVVLRIRENGAYYYANSASGVRSCGQVTYLDESTGYAVLEGDVLTLYPSQRRLEVLDCAKDDARTLPNDPIELRITNIQETRHLYGGLRTYAMEMVGGPQPYYLTLLHRPPLAEPEQPEQPANFVLGTSNAAGMQGLWTPDPGTDVNFFDPSSGEYYFPELNGASHHWLRFDVGSSAYETAVALRGINSDGPCKSDIIYYETGEARFATTDDVGGQGTHFVGHVRLEGTAARLIVRIRDCAPDDQDLIYDVPPQLSYYRWIWFKDTPDRITMDCGTFPQSEMQSTLCNYVQTSFSRRE